MRAFYHTRQTLMISDFTTSTFSLLSLLPDNGKENVVRKVTNALNLPVLQKRKVSFEMEGKRSGSTYITISVAKLFLSYITDL